MNLKFNLVLCIVLIVAVFGYIVYDPNVLSLSFLLGYLYGYATTWLFFPRIAIVKECPLHNSK